MSLVGRAPGQQKSNHGNFWDMTAYQDTTAAATRPQPTSILQEALSKGLSPNLCQTKAHLYQSLFSENGHTKAPIASLSGPWPPRVNLPCCNWTRVISFSKAEVLTNQLQVTSFWACCAFAKFVNNPARLSGLTLWLRANPDLTRGYIQTNTSVALAERSIFLQIISGLFPPKGLPVLTPPVTTGCIRQLVHQLIGHHRNRKIIKEISISNNWI